MTFFGITQYGYQDRVGEFCIDRKNEIDLKWYHGNFPQASCEPCSLARDKKVFYTEPQLKGGVVVDRRVVSESQPYISLDETKWHSLPVPDIRKEISQLPDRAPREPAEKQDLKPKITEQTKRWGDGPKGSYKEYHRLWRQHTRDPEESLEKYRIPLTTNQDIGSWRIDEPIEKSLPWSVVPRAIHTDSEMTKFVKTMRQSDPSFSLF